MDVLNATLNSDSFPMHNATDVPKPEVIMHLELRIAFAIRYYLPSILIVAGTVGNILSFLVFSSPAMKHSQTSFLFRLLAIYDTIALQIGLWGFILLDILHSDAYHATNAACKSLTYVQTVSRDLSVWLLCFISIERCVGVYVPHKVKIFITKKRVRIAVVIMIFASLLANASLIISTETRAMYDTAGNIARRYCAIPGNPWNERFAGVYWPWIDLFKYCFLPFAIMISCNIALVYKVIKAFAHRRQSTNQESDSSSQVSSMTMVLITVSITYIILTLPICIFFLTANSHVYIVGTHYYAQLKLWHTLGHLSSHANHCVNFFLYCISGKQFRAELLKLFSCKNK